jgi:hypothetical protein
MSVVEVKLGVVVVSRPSHMQVEARRVDMRGSKEGEKDKQWILGVCFIC